MRQLLCGLFLSIVLLAGCSPGEKKTEEATTSAPAKKQTVGMKLAEFTDNAWLRGVLPEKTVVYLRLPTPWFFFTGIENGFQYAQQNEQHVQQLEAIQQGLYQEVTSQLAPAVQPIASIFLKHMEAPLEVAALLNEGKPTAAPTIVLATKLAFETVEDFHANLTGLFALNEMIEETDPADPAGYGAFAVPAYMTTSVYRFNPDTKELLVVTSNSLGKDSLNAILSGIKPISPHPMHDLENKIDSSMKGMFGYIDVKTILPAIRDMIPLDKQAGLTVSGLDRVNALAFGYGASRDKTRLKLLMDMPNTGLRAFLPSVKNSFDFSARGSIDSLGVLALPTEMQFRNIEGLVLSASGPTPAYSVLKRGFREQTGFEVSQLLNIFGPEMAFFSDEISDFLAVRVQNPEQFGQLIQKAVENGWIQYDEYKRDNFTIKHIAAPFTDTFGMSRILKDELKDEPFIPVLLTLFEKVHNHYYWVEEDGFIILTSIPQPLIERALRKEDTVSVKDWLAASQHHDLGSALVAFSTGRENISRDFYYHYLQLLHALADISGAQIDFLLLPHAGELQFAEKGSVGISLDSSENYLALEASFEESLIDLFYTVGGTYESAAVVGVLAAVAIPQFEAYRKRAAAQQ